MKPEASVKEISATDMMSVKWSLMGIPLTFAI
jgi:hypothetical protein